MGMNCNGTLNTPICQPVVVNISIIVISSDQHFTSSENSINENVPLNIARNNSGHISHYTETQIFSRVNYD